MGSCVRKRNEKEISKAEMDQRIEEHKSAILTLPTELLVYIISILSTARDSGTFHEEYERLVKPDHCGLSLCGLIIAMVMKIISLLY